LDERVDVRSAPRDAAQAYSDPRREPAQALKSPDCRIAQTREMLDFTAQEELSVTQGLTSAPLLLGPRDLLLAPIAHHDTSLRFGCRRWLADRFRRK
jgi:hypothetical protein